ncbi:MAG: exopolysaccharide Pel transporter PelG [Parachlamydiaceae bacterium]
MAGIGFVLRKLVKKHELYSYGAAFFHSMMASAGPWIITIITLGSFFLLSQSLTGSIQYIEFRMIILFNFSLSLVIAAPIANCATRYLADLLYKEKYDAGSGLMISMLMILFLFSLPFSFCYYYFFTEMSPEEKFQAILNFVIICSIWHVSIFISTLKYYKAVTLSFLIGMGLSLFAVLYLLSESSLSGLVSGFNLGLGFILASLLAIVFSEYPPYVLNVFHLLNYFIKYWEIPVGFFFYAVGLWADKWIMWFSPESTVLPNHMRMYPDYDTATFVSYLTVIPSMALFLLNQETFFFESYYRYFQGIQNEQNFHQITKNNAKLKETLLIVGRQLILTQLFVCFIAIVFAPYIFNALGINFIQFSIFRIGCLGASFQILSLFFMVLLQYFDDRRNVLYAQFLFFILNTLLTSATLYGGFPWYGYGFFGASLITFAVSIYFLENYFRNLEYNIFVRKNIQEFKSIGEIRGNGS